MDNAETLDGTVAMPVGDVALLVDAFQSRLGEPSGWNTPVGYPDSLALCVLDSIWSIGVRYQGVENVLRAYRDARRAVGADPATDSASALLRVIDAAGGPDGFASLTGNHQRTSTKSGVLKSEAVYRGALALTGAQVDSPAQLRSTAPDGLDAAKSAWLGVPGQRSGISWRYLLLLAGVQEVKPDRMVVGFVRDALGGRSVSSPEAGSLVLQAARALGVDMRALDHRIWLVQSNRVRPQDS